LSLCVYDFLAPVCISALTFYIRSLWDAVCRYSKGFLPDQIDFAYSVELNYQVILNPVSSA